MGVWIGEGGYCGHSPRYGLQIPFLWCYSFLLHCGSLQLSCGMSVAASPASLSWGWLHLLLVHFLLWGKLESTKDSCWPLPLFFWMPLLFKVLITFSLVKTRNEKHTLHQMASLRLESVIVYLHPSLASLDGEVEACAHACKSSAFSAWCCSGRSLGKLMLAGNACWL